MRIWPILLVVLASAAAASPFSTSLPVFVPGGEVTQLSLVAGAPAGQASATAGIFGIGNASFDLPGLERACWAGDVGCATGNVSLRLHGNLYFFLHGNTSLELHAEHAIAVPVDFGPLEVDGLRLGAGLIAVTVNGTVATRWSPAPVLDPMGTDNSYAVVAADDDASIVVLRDGQVVQALRGTSEPVLFQGSPVVPRLRGDVFVLPMQEGMTLKWTRATTAAATAGSDIDRMFGALRTMTGGGSSNSTSSMVGDLGSLKPLVAAVFDGATLGLVFGEGPRGVQVDARNLTLSRMSSFTSVYSGGALLVQGDADLAIHDGAVDGAQPSYGIGFVHLVWWSWLLWILAIAAFVMRIVKKAPADVERWKNKAWIGVVATPIALLLGLLMWDAAVYKVTGIGILASRGTEAFPVALGLVLLLGLAIEFSVILPLSILLRNSARLLGLGKFMNLGRPTAILVGFALAMTLVHTFLNAIVRLLV